jgi:hypothetical protein
MTVLENALVGALYKRLAEGALLVLAFQYLPMGIFGKHGAHPQEGPTSILNIDPPTGHGSPPNCPSDHVENRCDDDGGSDGNECIEENAMSSS